VVVVGVVVGVAVGVAVAVAVVVAVGVAVAVAVVVAVVVVVGVKMIYRTNDVTKWTQAVIADSQVLPGLETMTGADLLVSPLSQPRMSIVNESLPSRTALHKHLRDGLLVQVKRGRDFTSSIPDLEEILFRMREHTSRPWLLIVADLKANREGQCIVDGQDSGFSWNAVDGALCWWQLRGGMVSILGRDGLIGEWVKCWVMRLERLAKEPAKQIIRPTQQILFRSDPRLDILAQFPLLGAERARALLDSQGTLANCLTYLSDRHSPEYCKVAGIGGGIIEKSIQLLGLGENEILFRTSIQEEANE